MTALASRAGAAEPETRPDLDWLTAAVIHLGRLALDFAAIDRTACWHPDGQARESDADHTLMLGWIAPALADRLYARKLDVGLVAQFALVHDMPEVYAGDTPTLRIDAQGQRDKAAREHRAVERITAELAGPLPWIMHILGRYERQVEPEARFVRAVDKLMPKIVHLLDGAKGLIEEDLTAAELRDIFTRQAADIQQYAGEFTQLMDLRAALADRTVAALEATRNPEGPGR